MYFRAPAFPCSVWQLILGFASSAAKRRKPPGLIPLYGCSCLYIFLGRSTYLLQIGVYSYINFGMRVNMKILLTILVGAVGHVSL